MTVRSVGNHIAVNFNSLNLPVSNEQALEILKGKNIQPIEVDILSLAKNLVGKARWKLPSRQWEAPHFFDCSSLTKWLYGQKGIWLPRRPLQQFEFCCQYGSIHELSEITEGDIVFTSSPYKQGVNTGEDDGIGHVCISIGDGQVICATNSEFGTGILEISIEKLLETRKLRAVGRPCNSMSEITTLMFPLGREVETTDDVRWIVLQSL